MSPTPDLAVVTGAASGIGRALSLELARRGHRLALLDRDADRLEETLEAVDGAFGEAVDVTDRDAVEHFAARLLGEHGVPRVVVHNAGISLAQRVEDMAIEDLERIMAVNFWGMVYGAKAFLRPMLETGGGMQVFISSIFGVVGVPTQSAYNASKFAIRGFAESLRQETAGRMDVLVVCPGAVRTNIVRQGTIRDWPTGRVPKDPAKTFERMARISPEAAARSIAAAIARRQPRLILGADAKFLDLLQRTLPGRYPMATRSLLRLWSR